MARTQGPINTSLQSPPCKEECGQRERLALFGSALVPLTPAGAVMDPTVPLETQLSLTDAIFPGNKPSSPSSRYFPSTGLCTGMCKVLLRRWIVGMSAEGVGKEASTFLQLCRVSSSGSVRCSL